MKTESIRWTIAVVALANIAMTAPGLAVDDMGPRPATCSEWRKGCLVRVSDPAICDRIMAQCMKIGRWIGGGTDYGPTERR